MEVVYNLPSILLLGYWLLWMLGVKLPGVGTERFQGWHCRSWNSPSSRDGDCQTIAVRTIRESSDLRVPSGDFHAEDFGRARNQHIALVDRK